MATGRPRCPAYHRRTVDILAKARDAVASRDWATAFAAFSARDADSLAPDDLDSLAQAAWWLGEMDASIAAHERAYELYLADGTTGGAVMSALYLSYDHFNRGQFAIGGAWQARAARLARKIADAPAAGYVGIVDCAEAFRSGDLARCMTTAKRICAIGEEQGDGTLVAWGLHWQGLTLVRQRQMGEGWTFLDEAMLVAASSTIQPIWTGFLRCNTLEICDQLRDPQRAWQWLETTDRWLKAVSSGPVYPGICRIYRAKLMRERGQWRDAEHEARLARDELAQVHISAAARANYELGEILRLEGELEAAEATFETAQQMGFDAQPGLALLHLEQGRMALATGELRRALDDAPDSLARSRLLPHWMRVALADGDGHAAAAALAELESAASDFASPGLTASAAAARGALHLAEANAEAARTAFRRSSHLWSDLDAPYEAALARVGAGEALALLGDADAARLEWKAARDIFGRLGARLDGDRVGALLGRETYPGGLTRREVDVLRLVALGRSNKEIAADFVISEHTVARHVSNILRKLEAPSRAAAAAYALRHRLA
jgi:DNA-binding CsgD family transcriptional regulator